jgi:hypothetical protein
MDMQALIEEMGALIAKIKSGEATLGEIEAFTAAAAQLHERAVVLRYKSYEAKVYGTPVEPVLSSPFEGLSSGMTPEETPEEAESSLLETEEAASPVEEQTEAPRVIYSEPDALSNPVKAELAAEEQTFDLFADEPEEEMFDLFSLDQDEEESESVAEEEVAMAEERMGERKGVAEEPSLTDSTPVAEEAVTTPQSTWVEPVLTEESVTTIDELAAEEEPQAEVVETVTPLDPPSKGEAETPHSATEHPVYNRLVTDDNSLAARLMAIRLETLKGAFGFNERLQIIRELFDGSNDAFNQAIDTLDELDSKNEARKVVSGYANKFAWDKDSDLALEFVQKVERRYA